MSGDESEIELTISEGEFARWLSPPQALQILKQSWEWEVAINTIIRYLMHEEMLARADRVKKTVRGETSVYRRSLIPSDEWGPDCPSKFADFWENGLFDWASGSGYDAREFSAFDVRFDPDVIRGMAKPLSADPQADVRPMVKNLKGAKRKSWWDDLWIEMIRRISAGTLAAKDKAELQRIMEDYVMNELNGEYGDSTLKPAASKLFEYLEEIRGK